MSELQVLNSRLRRCAEAQRAAAEQAVRDMIAGLNLAVRSEQSLQEGVSHLVVVDRLGREMRISVPLAQGCDREMMRAALAAFAVGATEIKWTDGTTLILVIEPETEQNDAKGSEDE